jgi:hypothetical protein
MHVPRIIEMIPVLIGLVLVGVLVLVILMVAFSKVRRLLFGRRKADTNSTGLKAFLENFD